MLDVFSRLTLGGSRRPATPLRRQPLVSVVIPCYNYGRYLRSCVDSVRTHQPGIELEIIIVDDASSDDTPRIASELEASDRRIRVKIRRERVMGHCRRRRQQNPERRGYED